MTLDDVIEYCGLFFDEYSIAVNLNYYRRAEPTDRFWDLWKADKKKLKDLGFGVYRDPTDNQFYVYDWSRKDKATQAQYDEQEATRMEAMFVTAYMTVSDYLSREPESKQKRKLMLELESCHDYVDMTNFVEQNMTCSMKDLLQ